MNPAAIHQLRKSLGHREIATPRFLLRWVAWEATQFRTLVAVAHARGWSVKDAETVLDEARISAMWKFRKTLRLLLDGEEPPIEPTTWAALEATEAARNKIVHGIRSYSPTTLDAFAEFLNGVTAHPAAWIGPLSVRTPRGPKVVKNPFAPLKAHGQRGRAALPVGTLRALLTENDIIRKPATASAVPSVAETRNLITRAMKSETWLSASRSSRAFR